VLAGGVVAPAAVDDVDGLVLPCLPGMFWQAASNIRLAGTTIRPSMRIVFMGSLVVHNARLMVLL
jgi:hypothetical protein